MIKIIEHRRGKSTGAEILIGDNTPFNNRERFFGERGRLCDYFHTRRDDQGPIVTVRLYGDSEEFPLSDHGARYKEIDLPTVQTSDNGKDWSNSYGIWLPDRQVWVGINRRITCGRPGDQYTELLSLVAPIEIDTNLASAIYEAVHGRRFEDDVAKLDPSTVQPKV